MKRLLRWASRLYPSGWRDRYGAEFEALLEDAPPKSSDLWDLLKGAFFMQTTRVNLVSIVTVCTVAGGLIAGIASLSQFSGYTSRGILRAQPAGPLGANALQQAAKNAVSYVSLAQIIGRPDLNLYREEKATTPMEGLVEKMRHDLSIGVGNFRDGRLTVSVAFRHPDAETAQRTTQALMERLRQEFAAAHAPVQVIEAAGPGRATMSGKRWKLVGVGAVSGLIAGLLCGALWSVVRNRERWSLRKIGGFAAAGVAVGIGVGMLLPDVYISTAVVRSSARIDPANLSRTVLSDEKLGEIIRTQGLYAKEMGTMPLAEIAQRMRRDFIRVREVDDGFRDGQGRVYVISFHDHDPVKAQRVTRSLIEAWLKTGLVTEARTEVLDPASLPDGPSSPNRVTITLFGTAAGLLLGFAFARMGRPAPLQT